LSVIEDLYEGRLHGWKGAEGRITAAAIKDEAERGVRKETGVRLATTNGGNYVRSRRLLKERFNQWGRREKLRNGPG